MFHSSCSSMLSVLSVEGTMVGSNELNVHAIDTFSHWSRLFTAVKSHVSPSFGCGVPLFMYIK